ncbi:flagellar hook-basal body complex protein FliE [Candidatus Paracaedibacter symbiosus]|uniref:flagellar hook-basal body complex protein FliE n=1 Tax=Candidatus Paracaedibacter symbiosus TaxID=244582 RepID=UPI0005099966|nr:flagellar hook-basal body complex protein FliE [Candidatus Paracaedibacter symbiosus]
MGIEAIHAITAGVPVEQGSGAAVARSDFGAVVAAGLGSVDASLKSADQQVRLLASGQEVAPHDVMISLEEARMHLMLLSEVRNRVVEAYQDLSRMQL